MSTDSEAHQTDPENKRNKRGPPRFAPGAGARGHALSLGSLGLLRPIAGLTRGGAATGPGRPAAGSPLFPAVPRSTWHATGTFLVSASTCTAMALESLARSTLP